MCYSATAAEFKKIPGTPIAYWATEPVVRVFEDTERLESAAPTRKGMVTARNEVYVRLWHEVSVQKCGLDRCADRETAKASGKKWFSYLKGGEYRKWYGNKCDVVNWENDGQALQTTMHPREKRVWATNFNLEYIFEPNVNWGAISSTAFSARFSCGGELFDAGGSACFPQMLSNQAVLGFLNSNIAKLLLSFLNPTLNFQAGNISNLPLSPSFDTTETRSLIDTIIEGYKNDWDGAEESWDFKSNPLIHDDGLETALAQAYQGIRNNWARQCTVLRQLEEQNNENLIALYNLQNEVVSGVPLRQVTLNCNPHYRYDTDKSESELEALLLADTMQEFISYAVGCMLGRYSLDKPGLILANQGDTLADYLFRVSSNNEPLDESRAINDPDSVVFQDDATVDCFSCGETQTISESRFVVSEYEPETESVRGRPLVYCKSCAGGNHADNVTWQQPLNRFSVRQAIENEWCETETLGAFLSLAGCFAHRIPVPLEEVTFAPDDDNVIPLLEGEWFEDDITERFKRFLKVTFGTENYDENLTFLENALYPDNETARKPKTIRDYFLKDFYNHHVKLYKKRPIYWLFSSKHTGGAGAFNALIYMHRYQPDTVSSVLRYLRDLRDKLSHAADHQQMVADSGGSTNAEKTKALKQVTALKKDLKELDDYERKILFPLAGEKVEIDLDDGVKVNYNKFGKALKKITGVTGKA